MADRQFANMPPQQPRAAAPLCFIVDEDFGLRQELSKELRRQAIDVVEFSNSARLLGMVDDQNPDIVLINVVGGAPHESLRALLALKDCRMAALCSSSAIASLNFSKASRSPDWIAA